MALCLLTFPLLWVGGLITSTDAGMAVPDWPTTYGYNMFSYPWQTWLFGPWDLFIEHGHRLLASVVGLVAIGVVIAFFRGDQRRWLRWFSVAALLLVIAQGVLGGVRVGLNDRQLAMAHGCVGPLFFAVTVLMWAATTRSWWEQGATIRRGAAGADSGVPGTPSRRLGGLLIAIALFAFVQLFLGAQLRHVPVATGPWAFAALVKLHLAMAGVLTLMILAALWLTLRGPAAPRPIARLTLAMGLALVGQLGLGLGTWLVKYGAPGWAMPLLPDNMGVNLADGMAQTHIATAHSACGALILGLATAAGAYAVRSANPISVPHLPAAPAAEPTA